MTNAKRYLITGATFALLSVALGAFGAHILRERLSPDEIAVFRTGVDYQAYHALALILLAGLWHFEAEMHRLKWICRLFTAGILIFSGTLYLLSLTGIKWLGAITPIGGLCFLIGWGLTIWVAASLPERLRR